MNKNDLLDKFSDIDPKLITDAYKRPRKSRGILIGVTSGAATIAAAAAIAAFVGTHVPERPPVYSTGIYTSDSSDPDSVSSTDSTNSTVSTSSTVTPPVETDPFAEYADLPRISFNDYSSRGGGAVIGIGTSKITRSLTLSELEQHSPWSEDAGIKTLPVYISNSAEPDVEKMREYVRNAAAAPGIDEDDPEITDNTDHVNQYESYWKTLEEQGVPEEEVLREINRIRRMSQSTTTVYGDTDTARLTLYTNYGMTVRFNEPIALPDGCSLGDDKTEYLAAVDYLADKFRVLLGYEKPVIEFYEGRYRVFEAAGDLETQIVNYSLKYANFTGNYEDASKLDMLRTYSTENCQNPVDYPILTARQAEDVLKSDSTPDEFRMPADAEIVKIDVVYSNLPGFTVVMPYYEFCVKTDETPEPGYDAVYDIYRLPAVPECFIDVEAEDYGARA
ncbi:MAG: hypothetical protein K2N38_08170 [Oscillospiraceae bacterium]|nr:hypothetical protein [Oscillospiraceae bacterium]